MTSSNRRHFTGHGRDSETGMDYMLARYYSSSLGRFMVVDPGDDTALEDPQSWNMYVYVRNNPIKRLDPNGEETFIAHDWVGYSMNPTSKFNPLHHDVLFATGPPTLEEAQAHPNGVVEFATDWHSDTMPQTSLNDRSAIDVAQFHLDQGLAERKGGEALDPLIKSAAEAEARAELDRLPTKRHWWPWKTSRANTRRVLRSARRQLATQQAAQRKEEWKKGKGKVKLGISGGPATPG